MLKVKYSSGREVEVEIFRLRCGQLAEPPTQASGRMAPSKTESKLDGWIGNWSVYLKQTQTGNMEDVRLKGHTPLPPVKFSSIKTKKWRALYILKQISEEKGGPSREEWNFPQVHCVYVGLACPYTEEKILGKSDLLLSNVSPLIFCLSCYLSISFFSKCLKTILCLLQFSHSPCADMCPGKEGISRPRGQVWEQARFPTLLPSPASPMMTQLFLF